MKRIIFVLPFFILSLVVNAQNNEVFIPEIKTLQVTVNDEWSIPPIMELRTEDYIKISFDELKPEYNRFIYEIRHCNADWSLSDLSELDYLNGFNNNPIEDYKASFNTTMSYNHYYLYLPNENVELTASGNYQVTIYKDGQSDQPVLKAYFSVIEKEVSVSATVSSNTDIDTNVAHQQVSFSVNYSGYNINNPQREVQVQVLQNRRWDNRVTNLVPSYMTSGKLEYNHNRNLIFKGGNEYRRFELTDIRYITQGIDKITYFQPYYHADLLIDERRRNYSFDMDQNGRYFIRSLQAQDNDNEADYVFIHFTLDLDIIIPKGDIYLNGDFAYGNFNSSNKMIYNPQNQCYESVQLLKQGIYNYQYLFLPQGSSRGETSTIEGDFYETENEYLILVYHRPFGERYDKLIGMQNIKFEQ